MTRIEELLTSYGITFDTDLAELGLRPSIGLIFENALGVETAHTIITDRSDASRRP